jgi:prepilin-type N-terminal cleavage/methylation domain-containing protein
MPAKRGFTLIELLVVIAIIGILATIIFVALGASNAKGRDARRISELRQIKYALELYYDENGYYPQRLYTASGRTSLQGSSFMPSPPKDPSGVNYNYASFGYYWNPDCTGYHLGATLEEDTNGSLTSDADKVRVTALPVQSPPTLGLCQLSTGVTATLGDFQGRSTSAAGVACNNVNGTAQPGGNETCYDTTD